MSLTAEQLQAQAKASLEASAQKAKDEDAGGDAALTVDELHEQQSALGRAVQQNLASTKPNPKQVDLTTFSAEELQKALEIRQAKERVVEGKKLKELIGDGKIYHTRIPNSTFIAHKYDNMGNRLPTQCEVLRFHGDILYVENPYQMTELDAIADTSGQPIYTKDQNSKVPLVDLEAFDQVRNRAAEVVKQIAATGARP